MLAVLAGALLLAWPALLNGYPIVFSDTHAFLVQAGEPRMVWDKPFVYGPFLLLHGGVTLWLPLAAQCVIVSHVLWLARAAFAPPGWRFHLGLCTGLAVGSAAPWFASLLMPDFLAPVVVLGLFLIGFAPRHSRWERGWLLALTGWAIASHLSYLPLAGVVVGLALLCGARRMVVAPLLGALALLVATNAIGHGRLGISPYGSVFALARLVSDGPAQAILARDCPQAGWRMCAWQGRFPADSDLFLWDGAGPVWSTPGGPVALAPEAAAIVRATVLGEPLAVLGHALANAAEQLVRVRLGDTLGPDWLESSITGSFRAYFPAAEMARFRAGRQMADGLRGVGAALNPLHLTLLLAGVGASLVVAWRGGLSGWLAVVVLVAVGANAATAGALSRPHDRYQARIAWLVLLPPVLGLRPRAVRPAPAPPRIAPSAP